ncbi:MAG: YidC/Oxa1 family membrane protein insertase [Candidatus Amesbacteria bacterium]|nr:YidC/Oxa1 family membrane protein insertase [Candidatus Amesbacteria bacterium]
MIEIWNTALFYPLLNLLMWLYKLTGNFGWAVISLTIGLRAIMTPLVWQSMKAMKKQQELAPELAKLKLEFKDKKQELMTAQAELYKKNGINPASGCLPQILQIVVLIALFNAFNMVLNTPPAELVSKLNPTLYSFNKLAENTQISPWFYSINMVKPDLINIPGIKFALPGVLVLLSALIQFLSSKMMMAANPTKADPDDVMASTSEQMIYMFPIMTIIFAYQFPAGLVLYWTVFSLVSGVQQYFATGWGGLTPWIKRLGLLK